MIVAPLEHLASSHYKLNKSLMFCDLTVDPYFLRASPQAFSLGQLPWREQT